MIIPLVVFQIFYLVLGRVLQGHFTRPMTQPFGPLWFLLSLVIWRLTIPIFSRIKFPVLIAILLPLLAGYDPQIGYSFSLARTLYFFPFYVLGFFYGISIINHVSENRILYILIFVIAMIFSVFALQPNLPADILYGSKGYQQLPAATSSYQHILRFD